MIKMNQRIKFQINGKQSSIIETDYFYISGWFIWKSLKQFTATLGGIEVDLCPVFRKDLDPEKTFSFVLYGKTCDFIGSSEKDLDFNIYDGNTQSLIETIKIRLNYKPDRASSFKDRQKKKKIWIEKHLANNNFDVSQNDAFDFISGNGAHNPSLKLKTDGISAHPHHKQLLNLVEKMPENGMALDVGCGFKMNLNDRIVGLEIFDYPCVDVLSFAQNLPFKDGSFDVVYSNAVLEHVDDPFLCAKEMIRVLKPGGTLMSCVPFLQAEHGYPHHYFNATRAGHAKLFEDGIEIEKQYVGDASHPWYIVMRSLMLYRSFLPTDNLKQKFGQLTIDEVLGTSYKNWQSHDLITLFPEDKKWILAGATTLIGKKKRC